MSNTSNRTADHGRDTESPTQNEKLEPSLRLSLSLTPDELKNSTELATGYDKETRLWEIIILYQGNTSDISEALAAFPEVTVNFLLCRFAIINTPQRYVEPISKLPSVLYMELPRAIYYQLKSAKAASCLPVYTKAAKWLRGTATPSGIGSNEGQGQQNFPAALTGRDVIVGIMDTGINFASPYFRNADGTSRIILAWDQTAISGADAPYGFGAEYDNAALNASLSGGKETITLTDISGHGTAVTQIAAGNDGVASESHIIFVKLGLSGQQAFPRTTQLMYAIDYIIRNAMSLGLPAAINISYGSNYGDHQGSSLLERYINAVATCHKTSICIGTGNEGASGTHYSVQLETLPVRCRFAIAPFERTLSLQLWKYYWDYCRFTLYSPDGSSFSMEETTTFSHHGTNISTYTGGASPLSVMQEIYLEFTPENEYIHSGIWEVEITPVDIRLGRIDAWLPDSSILNPGTGFLLPNPERTFTIPSTCAGCISVGAYDSSSGSIAAFSGRGYTLAASSFGECKPELCAPGVRISVGGQLVTGTSFSTPFVTGVCALMMEWGITLGADPFLYGDKLKALLIANAKKLPSFGQLPNSQSGYGALCAPDEMP